MKRNNKIKMLQQRLEKTLENEEEKFIEAVKKVLKKYPVYIFCSATDVEKIFKDIFENKDKNPIIIELLYEERKNKKNIKEKIEENVNEVTEDTNNLG